MVLRIWGSTLLIGLAILMVVLLFAGGVAGIGIAFLFFFFAALFGLPAIPMLCLYWGFIKLFHLPKIVVMIATLVAVILAAIFCCLFFLYVLDGIYCRSSFGQVWDLSVIPASSAVLAVLLNNRYIYEKYTSSSNPRDFDNMTSS